MATSINDNAADENQASQGVSYLLFGVLDSAPCFSLGIVYTVRGAAKRHEICQI